MPNKLFFIQHRLWVVYPPRAPTPPRGNTPQSHRGNTPLTQFPTTRKTRRQGGPTTPSKVGISLNTSSFNYFDIIPACSRASLKPLDIVVL